MRTDDALALFREKTGLPLEKHPAKSKWRYGPAGIDHIGVVATYGPGGRRLVSLDLTYVADDGQNVMTLALHTSRPQPEFSAQLTRNGGRACNWHIDPDCVLAELSRVVGSPDDPA